MNLPDPCSFFIIFVQKEVSLRSENRKNNCKIGYLPINIPVMMSYPFDNAKNTESLIILQEELHIQKLQKYYQSLLTITEAIYEVVQLLQIKPTGLYLT